MYNIKAKLFVEVSFLEIIMRVGSSYSSLFIRLYLAYRPKYLRYSLKTVVVLQKQASRTTNTNEVAHIFESLEKAKPLLQSED